MSQRFVSGGELGIGSTTIDRLLYLIKDYMSIQREETYQIALLRIANQLSNIDPKDLTTAELNILKIVEKALGTE